MDGEGRIERQPRLGDGACFVQATAQRQCSGERIVGEWIISVDFDSPQKSSNRVVVVTESKLRGACEECPEICVRVTRAEAQRVLDMGLSFFAAADEILGETDITMSQCQIAIEPLRPSWANRRMLWRVYRLDFWNEVANCR
jgi:hypothetical protein